MTGALYSAAYRRSGHPLRIFENSWACRADYNAKAQRLELRRLSRANFNFMLDGSEIDLCRTWPVPVTTSCTYSDMDGTRV